MQHLEIDPPEALRHLIKGLWYLSLDFAELPAGFEVLPDGYAEVVFHFGSPCRLSDPTAGQRLPSPFIMGLLQQPVRLYATGRVQVLGIQCFPWAVFEALGLPAGQDGVHFLQHPLAQLHAPLAELLRVGKVTEALAQLAAYFLTLRTPLVSGQLLRQAGAAMRGAHGTLPVRQVAAAAHATVRTLERKFKHATGYSVKDVSGLMRFEQVRNHLLGQPDANLAALAQEVGYADQAHLSREFKRYSGTTPAAFARRSKQGHPGNGLDFVAFIQA